MVAGTAYVLRIREQEGISGKHVSLLCLFLFYISD